MGLCVCGITADNSSTLCSRCSALQTLDLKLGATADEIKAAYHLLVKVWHPDRFANDARLKQAADEKLKAINAAYHLLTSSPGKETRKRSAPRATDGRAPRKPAGEAATPAPSTSASQGKTGAWRRLVLTFVALGAVQRLLIVACGIDSSALFAKFVDSQLASDPATARVYLEYRQAIAQQVDSSQTRFFDQVEQRLHGLNPFHSPAAAAPPAYTAPQIVPRPAPPGETQTIRAAKKVRQPTVRLMPYITVGLTKDEVTAIAGAPDSSSDDKLVYKGAEIDFKDGAVCGWKIDSLVSPLRVKLWPDAPVDTSQQYFAVGSTKNDVLVIQGTPTSFSGDRFGYGASEVYFQNNRVVRWKNDPASVPLRVASR